MAVACVPHVAVSVPQQQQQADGGRVGEHGVWTLGLGEGATSEVVRPLRDTNQAWLGGWVVWRCQ